MNYFDILLAKKLNGGGGGDITVEALNVTDNGTYTAPQGKAYSPVTVEVAPPEDSYQLKSITTPTSLATFNASAMPMPSLKVSVEAKQDLHGYDSPWPAGGGVNLFDKTKAENVADRVSVEQIDNGFIITNLTTGTYKSTTFYIDFVGHDGETVYLKGNISNSGSNNGYFSARFYDDTSEISGSTRVELYPTRTSHRVTVPTGTTMIAFVIYGTGSNRATVGETSTFTDVIFSLSDVPYEPYSNICPISGWDAANVGDVDDVDNPTVTQTTTISLGQTIYGAEVDVVNGTSKVTRLSWKFDGTETFFKSSKYPGSFYKPWSDFPNIDEYSYGIKFICSHAEYVNSLTKYEYGKAASDGSCNIWIMDSDATLEDFKAYLASEYAKGTPVTIVYELATPTTLTTQPTPIKSLNGQNNLSVDCGEVLEGEYFIALEGD